MFPSFELLIPSVLSVLAVVLWVPGSRFLCYLLVGLCFVSVIIAHSLNVATLVITVIAMLILISFDLKPRLLEGLHIDRYLE